MSPTVRIATVAWLILVAGMLAWRRPRAHVSLLIAGMTIDIALVLYLQVTRSAIQTALSFESPALRQAHIAVSALALVLYFPALWTGYRALRDGSDGGAADGGTLTRFRRFAVPAFVLRTVGLVFMGLVG